MPAACHSFGYIETGVKPGIVLASLHRKPRPPSSNRKSTRARPSQRSTSNTRTASARTSAVCSGVRGAGISNWAPSVTYLSS